MALSAQLTQKQLQKLVMTQDLRQSIELLPLSNQELLERIQNEIMENPFLEEDPARETGKDPVLPGADPAENRIWQENQKGRDPEIQENVLHTDSFYVHESGSENPDTRHLFIQNGLSRAETLSEHLLWQLRLCDLSEKEMEAGEFLISAIDHHGFLSQDLDSLIGSTGIRREDALKALDQIHNLDPVGCGARSIGETLIIQTRILNPENPPASMVVKILENHLSDLERLDYRKIEKETGLTREDIEKCVSFIRSLEPFPGTLYSASRPSYIIPDLIVTVNDGRPEVFVNDEWLPGLKINEEYRRLAEDKQMQKSDADREYLQSRLYSANWLMKSIEQRRITMYKVMKAIADIQIDFFLNGPGHLKALTLKDIAEVISMHESTVSRITSNKYVQTPWGIFELKYFFSGSLKTTNGKEGIASKSVKDRIKSLTDAEDPHNPLSDSDIVDILKKEGVEIARRTVAKYRKMLHILPAEHRKKIKTIK